MLELVRMHKLIKVIVIATVACLSLNQIAFAASTIGTGITTDGTLTVTGASTFTNDVNIDVKADATASSFTTTNSAAGTFGSQTSIDGTVDFVTYKGSVYVSTSETDSAGVYRYDSGTTWTLVTNAAGKIISGDTANIDAIVLEVWNGKLYAGSQTGSDAGALYSYDGTTWSLENVTRGTFDSANLITTVDGIGDLAVYRDTLYVSMQETASTSVYRFDASYTDRFVNTMSSNGNLCGATLTPHDDARFIVYQNLLFVLAIGGSASNKGAVCHYSGSSWIRLNSAVGSFGDGVDLALTNIDDVNSAFTFNGELYFGLGESAKAEIIKLTSSSTLANSGIFVRTNSAQGKVVSADAVTVNSIPAFTTLNGRLYAGTSDSTNYAGLYELLASGSWSLINSTKGTFGSETAVTSVSSLHVYNGTLYIGTTKSNQGSVYTWTKTSNSSYLLKFKAGSSFGEMGFVESKTALNNTHTDGAFLFSNPLSTQTGAYDYAEDYPTTDSSLSAGEIIAVDSSKAQHIKRAGSPDDKIIGIVSTRPGFRLSQRGTIEEGSVSVPVALSGRVPVKVSAENGPIYISDNITLSSIPGVGMKATGSGTIIGTALESLTEGTGTIMMHINLQWIEAKKETAQAVPDDGLLDKIVGLFKNTLGIIFETGKLIADIVEVKRGVIIHDTITDEPYCISVENGEIKATAGNCTSTTE